MHVLVLCRNVYDACVQTRVSVFVCVHVRECEHIRLT